MELIAAARRDSGASACNRLGNFYHLHGKYLDAESWYLRALKAWDSAHRGESRGLIGILNNLATLYVNNGYPGKAEKYCLRALTLSNDPDVRKSSLVRLASNLGRVHLYRGDLVQAEFYYRQALSMSEEDASAHQLEIAMLLNDLAIVELKRNHRVTAIEYAQRSIAIWRREAGHQTGLAAVLTNLGSLYYSAGKLDEAERAYREALVVIGNPIAVEVSPRCLKQLFSGYAVLLRKTGRSAEAKEMQQRAAAIQQEVARQDLSRYSVDVEDLRPKSK